jgi:hypothetical protein
VFPQARVVADEELLLDLHLLSVNVAQVMLVSWLSDMESTCIKEDTPYEQVCIQPGLSYGKKLPFSVLILCLGAIFSDSSFVRSEVW